MSTAREPVPDFRFDCHRCGHCCRVGHGQVWLQESDLAPMAARLDMEVEAFLRFHVRQVDGRLSLREKEDGSCGLLEGVATCRVYEERPTQCRSFPFWPAVTDSTAGLAAAAAYCPGIQVLPTPAQMAAVLPQVLALLEAEPRARAVEARDCGQRWASALEVDLVLAGGAAYLGEVDREVERQHALQDLAARTGYPWHRGPWPRLLEERRSAWEQHARRPSLAAEDDRPSA
ncbi:MAG: YkgJ family cysteine cluster protein [Planctomycetota bacterium]